jgi:hypothetical protein
MANKRTELAGLHNATASIEPVDAVQMAAMNLVIGGVAGAPDPSWNPVRLRGPYEAYRIDVPSDPAARDARFSDMVTQGWRSLPSFVDDGSGTWVFDPNHFFVSRDDTGDIGWDAVPFSPLA